MPYKYQYGLAIVFAAFGALIGSILLVPSGVLGLDSTWVGWLGVIGAWIGAVAAFLPKITKYPQDEREGLD